MSLATMSSQARALEGEGLTLLEVWEAWHKAAGLGRAPAQLGVRWQELTKTARDCSTLVGGGWGPDQGPQQDRVTMRADSADLSTATGPPLSKAPAC